MTRDERYMLEALQEARKAFEAGETPVGAVLVCEDAIVARAHNERETRNDPTAHAEVLAIRSAAEMRGDWRLTDASLYVTLEPCPMCAGAIVAARLARVVFGAYDEQAGCAGSVYDIPEDPAFAHFTQADGGVLREECEALLHEFFRRKRMETCAPKDTES